MVCEFSHTISRPLCKMGYGQSFWCAFSCNKNIRSCSPVSTPLLHNCPLFHMHCAVDLHSTVLFLDPKPKIDDRQENISEML